MYTVEGSLVFSICFLTLLSIVLLSFSQYDTGIRYIKEETKSETREAAIIFRNLSYAAEYIGLNEDKELKEDE